MSETIFLAVIGLWSLGFLWFLIRDMRLRERQYKLDKHRYSSFLFRVESALRDFILAYDDQEPECLLGAYQEAEELLKSIEKFIGKKGIWFALLTQEPE